MRQGFERLQGRVQTDTVADAVRHSAVVFGNETALETRTVAIFVGPHEWIHHATVARIIAKPADLPPTERIDVDRVSLIRETVDVGIIIDSDRLRDTLASWRGVVEASSGYGMPASYGRRERSRNAFDDYPCWIVELTEEIPSKPSGNLPPGPFLDPKTGTFGKDLTSLAATWLKDPYFANTGPPSYLYRLVIPDHRARIAELEVSDGDLAVRVEGLATDVLYCAVEATDFRGVAENYSVPFQDGRAVLQFRNAVSALELWVLTEDSEALDHYYESGHGRAWERTLYNEPSDGSLALQNLLDGGESEITEFKEWIAVANPDSKSIELLETVCAFTNVAGGTVLIGADDHGNPVGTGHQLFKAYGEQASGDVPKMKNLYARDVRQYVNEGVSPRPTFDIAWEDTAGAMLLRVDVQPRGSGTLHQVVQTRETYRRAGGTNRKVTVAEAIAAQEQRTGPRL